jgi:hypothetical protein
MAVSILRRPYGYVRTSNEGTGSVNESGGVPGVVNIVSTAHGIADGATIYLKCPIENYNGFVLIEVADANNFRLKDVEGNYIDYLTGTAGTEVSFFVHNTAITWNCVHLPIVYKLSNTLWPTNSVDTVRTISAVTDSNGYCSMTASGDIKATGSAAALEFVKITGSTDDDLNGIWQIITYSSDTSFVLDIPYSSANDTALTGASIQYYYNNYVTKVQIWGGLNEGHPYYGQKPYELLATLDLIPDEDNVCLFSVSEILKKHIELKNNLLLGTLPNNLDAWTGFFIKHGEEFDDSDGTTLSRSTVSYTSDLNTFEGYAANSLLPFKNMYSGALSEYTTNDDEQKFLTSWDEPTLFTGHYFDLSIIFNVPPNSEEAPLLRSEFYKNGVKITETFTETEELATGIYRLELDNDIDCDVYDRVDASVQSNDAIVFIPSGFDDNIGSWTTKTLTVFTKAVTPAINAVESQRLLVADIGDTVRLSYTVTIIGTWTGQVIITFGLRDSGNNSASILISPGASSLTYTANGTYTIDMVLQATAVSENIIILLNGSVLVGTANVTITPTSDIGLSYVISETKTIDINCDCVPSQAEEGIYLSWLNNLGGFDYWLFTAYKDHIINITDSGETKVNTFPNWPVSYGEFADTIRKQTFRDSETQILVRSQHLTKDQITQIQSIKTSPLVQIVNSIYDRRTVLVDTDSFTVYQEEQKLYQIQFTITYTDDVPSQRVRGSNFTIQG